MKIALINSGFRGIRQASIALALRLIENGMQVLYCSPQDLEEELKAYELPFVRVDDYPYELSGPLAGNGPDFSLEDPLNRRSLVQQMSNLEVDECWIDIELHEVILAAIEAGQEVRGLTQWFENRPNNRVPNIQSLNFPSGNSPIKRLELALRWKKRRWQIARVDRAEDRSGSRGRRQELLNWMKEIDFQEQQLIRSWFPPLWSYCSLPIYSLALPEMDFPGNSYPNIYTLGPQISQDSTEEQHESIAIARSAQQAGQQVVYAVQSSMTSAEKSPYLTTLLAWVSENPNFCLIYSEAGHIRNGSARIEDRVHCFDWVPQKELLAYTDLCVNHGGIHTVHECIWHQVPMLIFPGGQHDQNGVAARAAFHQIAYIEKNDKDCSVGQLNKRIHQLLADYTVKMNLREMQNVMEGHAQKKWSSESLNQWNN